MLRYKPVARYLSFDTALKDKEGNAYSAMVVFELMTDYRLRTVRVWRARPTFPELPHKIRSFAERYNNDGLLRAVIIEDKASGISALQTLRKTAPHWLARLLVPIIPTTDKIMRAEQAAVWCSNGSVLLPAPADDVPWLNDFETELFDFPASEFNDQVDAVSQGIIYLENILAQGFQVRSKVNRNAGF
jgi:predicted phage terminase large subunit-like protein